MRNSFEEALHSRYACKVLEIDTENREIFYMIALGYRVNEQEQRFRRDFDDVMEFR